MVRGKKAKRRKSLTVSSKAYTQVYHIGQTVFKQWTTSIYTSFLTPTFIAEHELYSVCLVNKSQLFQPCFQRFLPPASHCWVQWKKESFGTVQILSSHSQVICVLSAVFKAQSQNTYRLLWRKLSPSQLDGLVRVHPIFPKNELSFNICLCMNLFKRP